MQRYIGTKLINAKPMKRGAYNEFRGWNAPKGEDQSVDGYLVEYLDGGEANTPEYAGYVSWSPQDVFERSYRQITGMTFGLAIEALKAGAKVARAGWNGKGMWLCSASNWNASLGAAVSISLPGDWQGFHPFIAMYTADKRFVPWLASQTDMLAEDWLIVD